MRHGPLHGNPASGDVSNSAYSAAASSIWAVRNIQPNICQRRPYNVRAGRAIDWHVRQDWSWGQAAGPRFGAGEESNVLALHPYMMVIYYFEGCTYLI